MLLFVYGTLRKGMKNHELLMSNNQIYKGLATTVEPYYMVAEYTSEIDEFADGRSFVYPTRSLSHPYIIQNTINIGKTYYSVIITGELYDISDNIIQILDIHEGCPTVYVRENIKITIDDIPMEVYAYILNNKNIINDICSCNTLYDPVLIGDWIKYSELNT
jgi:gamma-glutamylcyclotransferase (GGCT)/AIG2-like uncharacterized protein YtfP